MKAAYDKKVAQHVRELDWTVPVLENLLKDRSVGPLELAIIATQEMEPADLETRKRIRDFVKQAIKHPAASMRLEAVTGLAAYGHEGNVTAVICENLRREDGGPGWIDAALLSNSPECREALDALRQRLQRQNPHDERLERLIGLEQLQKATL